MKPECSRHHFNIFLNIVFTNGKKTKMIIDKNSWHYKLYSHYFLFPFGNYVPGDTNLCAYMRTIFLWLPLKWLLMIVMAPPVIIAVTFMWGFVTAGEIICKFPFGYKPSKINYLGYTEMVQYNTFKINGYNIYPWVPMLILAVLFVPTLISHASGWMITLPIVAAVALIWALTFLYDRPSLSVIRDWVSAKKQGVCPLIEFKG